MAVRCALVAVVCFIACSISNASACETAKVIVSGNLDSSTSPGGGLPQFTAPVEEQVAAAQVTQEVEFFDSTGESHRAVAAFYRGDGSNFWTARFIIVDGKLDPNTNPLPVFGDTPLQFNGNGERPGAGTDQRGPYRWLGGGSNEDVAITFNLTSRPEVTETRAEQDGRAGGCLQRGSLDFDGDGRDDFAIWRPEFGMWAVLKSSVQGSDLIFKQWGLPGDYPIPGDYTGDGKADLVLFRAGPAFWFVCKSELNYDCAQPQVVQFGLPGDIPIKGDYDGDGILDFAVYRLSSGTFFYRSSRSTELVQRQWGLAQDIPLQAVINSRPR